MKISRRGASADYGESSIELLGPEISWDKSKSRLIIKKRNVKDFSSKSKHSYTIGIDATELVDIIRVMSEAAAASPDDYEKQFEQSLKPLIRLIAVIGGLKPENAAD